MTDAMSVLGAALLPVVVGLLLEELTFGGLVRLLLAPRPEARVCRSRRAEELLSTARTHRAKQEVGGTRCSH